MLLCYGSLVMSKAEEVHDLILGDYSPSSYKEWMAENEAALVRAFRFAAFSVLRRYVQ